MGAVSRVLDGKERLEALHGITDYKPIEVKDLPQAVQDTIKKDFADLTIKEAAVEESEEGTKTYKVTFTDAEGTDSEVFFNEKGEVLK